MKLTSAMCWKLIAQKVQTAIWIKPEDNSCLQQNVDQKLISLCDPKDDDRISWNIPLRNCVSERRMQKLPPRPQRQFEYFDDLSNIGMNIKYALYE